MKLHMSGAQVENTLIKVEPMLIHINPKAVNVEASLIEVAPKLISVSPYGAALSIELPGHIHVEGSAIEVCPYCFQIHDVRSRKPLVTKERFPRPHISQMTFRAVAEQGAKMFSASACLNCISIQIFAPARRYLRVLLCLKHSGAAWSRVVQGAILSCCPQPVFILHGQLSWRLLHISCMHSSNCSKPLPCMLVPSKHDQMEC